MPFLSELDFLSDHNFLTVPAPAGGGTMYAGCACGWMSPAKVYLKTEASARKLWDAHMADVRYHKPQTKG